MVAAKKGRHPRDDRDDVHGRVGQRKAVRTGHHETPAVTMVAAWMSALTGVVLPWRREAIHRAVSARFTGSADEEQQADERDHGHSTRADDGLCAAGVEAAWNHLGEVQRPEGHEDRHHAENEPEVAHTVHHEGLDAGVGCRLFLIPNPISR